MPTNALGRKPHPCFRDRNQRVVRMERRNRSGFCNPLGKVGYGDLRHSQSRNGVRRSLVGLRPGSRHRNLNLYAASL